MEIEYLFVNGSDETGIDVMRTKIRSFASSMSLDGKPYKVVIFDEGDNLNASSTQPALKGFIEEFSSNCRFIFTCNHKHRLIEPIHSRCPVIDFVFDKTETKTLSAKFLTRLKFILSSEGVKAEDRLLVELILKYSPDWRRIINECQLYSTSGVLTPDVLLSASRQSIDGLVNFLKTKDFTGMRGWIALNSSMDANVIFRRIYDGAYDYLKAESIPGVIVTLAEYQYKHPFVADKEINLVACMTEIMSSAEFK